MTYLIPDDELTPETFTARGEGCLPGYLGITVDEMARDRIRGYIDVQPHHVAPNRFLHAGSVVTLADSLCAFGTVANLKSPATGFTTIELKTNFFSSTIEGRVFGVATPIHLGGSTHVWDCEVTREDGRRMALFRCSQMVLRAK